MWAIASRLRRHWVEIAWGLFAAGNVAVILILTRWETIPFHFVWVSLTLVYGFRRWRLGTTIAVLTVVSVVTAGALLWTVTRGHERLDEIAEVPLMAGMFVAMVWHATRRQAAMEEVRRLAESEHRLLERQREFVRDASHELKTPITVARGHAELIRASRPDPRIAEDVDVVLDELSRLSRLSERLLILAAAEHPGFLTIEPVQVEPLIVDMVRRWSRTASRRWLVAVQAEGSLPADRERLEVALDALIENAVKFTGDGDGISISGRAEGSTLIIDVADTGVGIARDQLGRVFDRFSRVDGDRGRRTGGTGLGLAIVKAIVEAHDGSVGVESEVGRGTTFEIRLPGFRAEGVPTDRTAVLPEAAPAVP